MRLWKLVLMVMCAPLSFYAQIESNTKQIDNLNFEVDIDENLLSKYAIGTFQLQPSLSTFDMEPTNDISLMEVDLSVDLRKQSLRNKEPFMMVPDKRKFVKSDYAFRLPYTKEKKSVQLRVSGPSNIYGNGSFNSNHGVRNRVYRDASFYSRNYNPFTGLPY